MQLTISQVNEKIAGHLEPRPPLPEGFYSRHDRITSPEGVWKVCFPMGGVGMVWVPARRYCEEITDAISLVEVVRSEGGSIRIQAKDEKYEMIFSNFVEILGNGKSAAIYSVTLARAISIAFCQWTIGEKIEII